MKTDYESYGDALKTTQEQHRSILSKGLSTPNHYFYIIETDQGGRGRKEVGQLWLSVKAECREAFLYHIIIHEPERRKGYGLLALALIEQRAKDLGCRILWLNIMAHNDAAKKLYLSGGYQVAAMHMNKLLET